VEIEKAYQLIPEQPFLSQSNGTNRQTFNPCVYLGA